MRRSILACGLLLAFAGICSAGATAAGFVGASGSPPVGTTDTVDTTATTDTTDDVARRARAARRAAAYWRRHVKRFRAGTRHWLTVVRGRPPRVPSRSLAGGSPAQLRDLARVWHRREHSAWHRAKHPPNLGAWRCIHRFEGSWRDDGAPYWGGLQMSLSFQRRYGGWLLRHKGTADHWSRLEQIWVGVRAWRVRGFSPWPNTARYCGVM